MGLDSRLGTREFFLRLFVFCIFDLMAHLKSIPQCTGSCANGLFLILI